MENETFYVDSDIQVAESLPPSAYLDQAVLDKELQTLFRHAWLLATPTTANLDVVESLGAPGSRVPVIALGSPYYLHRSEEGTLRGFPNVCTHAWHTLVTAPGAGKVVVCPQHGRTFDANGQYRGQPGMPKGLPNFPRLCDHLRVLKAATWGPLAFLALDDPEAPFDAVFAAINESLGNLPLDTLRRLPVEQEVRIVEGNWKQHAGNYLDVLHIPFIHGDGGLASSVHMDSYQTEVYNHSVLQWAYAKDPSLGFDPELLPERFAHPEKRVFALWWFLYPNVTLNIYPWGLSVNLYEPIPDRPDATRFHWMRWTWDNEKAANMDQWHMEDVDQEDVDALREVTKGLRSVEAVRGRFAPGAEEAPHWFQRRVYEALFSA